MIARKKGIHISHNPETRSLASFVMRPISVIAHGATAIYTARVVYRTADLYVSASSYANLLAAYRSTIHQAPWKR